MLSDSLVGFVYGSAILAAPLIVVALGELISERAGVLNIGLEGLMLCGALAAFAVTISTGSLLLGMLAAIGASALIGALFAAATVVFRSDQVIAGTAVNLIGIGLTGALFRSVYAVSSAATTIRPSEIADGGAGGLIPGIRSLTAGWFAPTMAVVILVTIVWVALYRTRCGLLIRACGENPGAVDASGHDVLRIRLLAVLLGASFAGLGGGFLSVIQGNTFVEGMTSGRGFIALALVIFGRWSPLGILLGGLFFGMAAQLQYTLPGLGFDGSSQVVAMVPYLATLGALALFRHTGAGPEALGRPWKR